MQLLTLRPSKLNAQPGCAIDPNKHPRTPMRLLYKHSVVVCNDFSTVFATRICFPTMTMKKGPYLLPNLYRS